MLAARQMPRLVGGQAVIEAGLLSITGKAKSVDDHQAMLAEIGAFRDKPAEGIAIGVVEIVPPFVDPYVWRAARDGDRLVLSGYVPSEAVRAQISDEAGQLFAGMRIDNRLAIAAGDPKMDWIGALRFSLGQLALLARGTVSLTGRAYGIDGEAASTRAFQMLTEQLERTLPASMELSSNAVAPAAVSPFTFEHHRHWHGPDLRWLCPRRRAPRRARRGGEAAFPGRRGRAPPAAGRRCS